jgi:hypothetical protein
MLSNTIYCRSSSSSSEGAYWWKAGCSVSPEAWFGQDNSLAFASCVYLQRCTLLQHASQVESCSGARLRFVAGSSCRNGAAAAGTRLDQFHTHKCWRDKAQRVCICGTWCACSDEKVIAWLRHASQVKSCSDARLRFVAGSSCRNGAAAAGTRLDQFQPRECWRGRLARVLCIPALWGIWFLQQCSGAGSDARSRCRRQQQQQQQQSVSSEGAAICMVPLLAGRLIILQLPEMCIAWRHVCHKP